MESCSEIYQQSEEEKNHFPTWKPVSGIQRSWGFLRVTMPAMEVNGKVQENHPGRLTESQTLQECRVRVPNQAEDHE